MPPSPSAQRGEALERLYNALHDEPGFGHFSQRLIDAILEVDRHSSEAQPTAPITAEQIEADLRDLLGFKGTKDMVFTTADLSKLVQWIGWGAGGRL